jgi:hypothetical protein
MNLGEAKQRVAMLTGNYSELGTPIVPTAGNVADMYLKMHPYFDMAQKKIAESIYIKKYFYISHLLPFCPEDWQLKTYTHTNEDIIFSAPTAYAYCFKVDGVAEVVIEGIDENGNATELDTVTTYSTGGFEIFKDLIDLDGATYSSIRLRFSGDNYYNIKDIILYNCNFANRYYIPDFGAHIKYSMPSDFYKALEADIKRGKDYEKLANYTWESPTEISVSVYEKGEIRIEYAAKVSTIDSTTLDSYVFEISETAQTAMLYYVAAKMVQKLDPAQHQLLMADYVEAMANITNDTGLKKQQRTVKNVRSW